MARIEEKVRELVSSDADMESAIETVLDEAEDGEVAWVDVKGDIESGQWGRLIEKGILVEGEEGFRIEDPEAVRQALAGDADPELTSSSVDLDDIEETSWSVWDKAAGVVTLGMFAGYSLAQVRSVVGGAMDLALGPILDLLPFYVVVLLIGVGTGLYTTLMRALLMDMDKMALYQERMQDIQDRRKKAKERGDDAAMEAIQDEQMEAMGDQLGMFKEQFRPMVWIMVVTIPFFLWMYWSIGLRGAGSHHDLQQVVLPLMGQVDWSKGVLGPIQAWIVWYFLCSMAFTQVIQKALDIEMTPTTS